MDSAARGHGDGQRRPQLGTFGYAGGELAGQPVEVLVPQAGRDDLASLAWAVAAEQGRRTGRLHDRVASALFHVGLSLRPGSDGSR